MMIKRLIVKNWRNFRHIDVRLRERQFIVGRMRLANPISSIFFVASVSVN